MTIIRLQSSDGEDFPVDIKVAKQSGTIRTMLEDLGEEEDGVVPLPNVKAETLKKVIEWCIHHQDDPAIPGENTQKQEKTRSEDISPWNIKFLKVDDMELFEIIQAANYLDIRGLLEVCCKSVANKIKGKSPDEIRKVFNVTTDLFTVAEEVQARKDNEWNP